MRTRGRGQTVRSTIRDNKSTGRMRFFAVFEEVEEVFEPELFHEEVDEVFFEPLLFHEVNPIIARLRVPEDPEEAVRREQYEAIWGRVDRCGSVHSWTSDPRVSRFWSEIVFNKRHLICI
jgi:hypothetical protein